MSQAHLKPRGFQNRQLLPLFAKRMLFFLCLILIPVMITSIGFIVYTNRTLDKETRKMNESALAQVKSIADTILGQSRTLAASLSIDGDVRLLMTPSYRLVDTQKLSDTLRNHKYINTYLYSVEVYSPKNKLAVTPDGESVGLEMQSVAWYTPDRTDTATRLITYLRNGIYPYLLGIVKPVVIQEESAQGAVATLIDLAAINEIVNASTGSEPAGKDSQFYILDAGYRVIAADNLKPIFGQKAQDILGLPADFISGNAGQTMILDQAVVSLAKSDQFPLHYLSVMPLDYRRELPRDTRELMVIIFLTAILISIAVTALISYKSVSFVDRIIDSFKNPRDSKMTEKDLSSIVSLLKQTSDETFEVELQSRMFLLQQTQASSLQAQMNPHFLRNTLDTINWMAFMDMGGKNRVSSALVTLSSLLQYSIYGYTYSCPLRDEMEHVRAYVGLLNLRYNDTIQVRFEIAPELEPLPVVRFMLQPLVENAVYHGLKPQEVRGQITIQAWRDKQDLLVAVEDSGAGISREQSAAINQRFDANLHLKNLHDAALQALHLKHADAVSDEQDKSGHGVGIPNIDMRIKLLYGIRYGLTIMPVKPSGTRVEVRMPLVEEIRGVKEGGH